MREADFRIVANGADITAKIRDRLIMLSVHDAAGIESDTVAIELDNRDAAIPLPPTGASLQVWIGPRGGLVFKGVYEVDELEEPLAEEVLVIHGKAARMSSAFKAPRDRTFDDITFGDLVRQIAEEHDYTPAISEALAGVRFAHIDQRGESDMNLLTRLARDRGAVAKPVADRLVVVPRAASQSVSGAPLGAVVIDDPSDSDGRVTITRHDDYRAVVAHWFDEPAQQRRQVRAGEGEPVYTLRDPYDDAEAAQAAADAKLGQLRRGTATLSLIRPLTPGIVAEGEIVLVGHKASANGRWLVETATHEIRPGSPASTQAECVTPDADEEDEDQEEAA